MDKNALGADHIVVVNRVKPHTDFEGDIGSGLMKMLAIGLGKQKGASFYHGAVFEYGFERMITSVARHVVARANVAFGLAIVENAYDETAHVIGVPAEELEARERELFKESKRLMPRLPFDEMDVLIVDEMGKNISGAGFDPNVTGRNCRDTPWSGPPEIQKIVCLDLTDKTGGNATGLGAADVITMKLYQRMDIAATYANVITGAYLDGAAIPMIMNTEAEAIRLAVKTLRRVRPEDARIVHIKNTLELTEIAVSEPLRAQVEAHPQMQINGNKAPFAFGPDGSLERS